MRNQAIKKLATYRLRWSELDQMNVDDRALFAFACLAVSEISILRRLNLLSLYTVDDNKHLEAAAELQRNLLLRVSTGKIFEFSQAFEEKIYPSKKFSAAARSHVEIAWKSIEQQRKSRGYKIAEKIRNKVGFHYDFGQIKAQSSQSEGDIDASLYFTEEDGNCFFPIGDRIAFGRLEVLGNIPPSPQNQKRDEIAEWIDWEREMLRVATKFHQSLLESLILPLFPGRLARETVVWFDTDLIATTGKSRLPLFLRVTP